MTTQRSIEETWTVISNQIIKYRLPHARFDQISDHKHDMTCMESYPLSYEMDGCFFLKHGLKSDCSEKILKNFSKLKK